MNAKRLTCFLLTCSLATPTAAQVSELTPETIFASPFFSPTFVSVEWREDGRHYTTVERDDRGHTDLYQVEIASGRRELLVRGSDLVPPNADQPIAIEAFDFSTDGDKLLIATDRVRIWRRSSEARFFVWDFGTQRLTPVSRRPGRQRYAKFSPDARRVAFVRDNDIYVTDLESGDERALTHDGGEDIINGATDWVYEEELSLYDGFRWSPDGRRIAFLRFDQRPIPPFYLVDQMALYPQLKPVRYPKAGTANSRVALGVIELSSGEITWIDVEPEGGEDFYIARMDFAASPDEVWFIRLNRHQNRLQLSLADTRSGKSRVVMTDTDDAWIDIDESGVLWIQDGDRFLYRSDRDGYSQLYLYERDGTLVRKLTTGAWDVLQLHGVDERRNLVYLTGAADGPLVRPLYRTRLDGKGFERITGATGSHQVSFDPTFTYFLDTYSEAGVPPVQTLRTADGQVLRTLSDNRELRDRLAALELAQPEFISVPAADGTELNAWIIRPADFDPARRYPLLMYVYGGPGSQTVTDSWWGDRYLWHQSLAQKGYLVASVDNRGTGARGTAFKKITYLDLGHYETADQIAAARHLAALPYVDSERIGIWGKSYGGYMAALCILKGSGVFSSAISVAPVTDWRLYDTIYTERYMRTPEENPEGYQRSAPLSYADRLAGDFLLVHGTGDDNVHPQNSLQLVQHLIQANKHFQFRLYPNKDHGLRGSRTRTNLYELLTHFITEAL